MDVRRALLAVLRAPKRFLDWVEDQEYRARDTALRRVR